MAKTETSTVTSLAVFIDGHMLASHDFHEFPHDWTLVGCVVIFINTRWSEVWLGMKL